MLIPFYLDEQFFQSVYFYDENLDSIHDNFLNFWESYGVLIYSKNQSINFYRQLIKSLPVNFQQRWFLALEGFSKFYVDNETIKKFRECNSSFNQLLESRIYFNFGLTDKDSIEILESLDGFMDFDDFQIKCVENYTSSNMYKKIIDNSQALIIDNQNISEIWDVKFKNLTKYSNNITIVDRYLFRTIIEDMESRDTSVKIFFNLLSQNVSNKISFTIISGGDQKNSESHNNIRGFFDTKICNSPPFRKIINSFEIYAIGDDFFQKYAHDRYLICDKHYCQIGTGFQLFRAFPISQTVCTLNKLRKSDIGQIVSKARSLALWKEDIL